MNRILVLAASMFLAAGDLSAAYVSARSERQYLWPEGRMPDAQPHQIAAMTDESGKAGFDPDAHRQPYLEWFPTPPAPNGACMVLISGGGYDCTCGCQHVREWNRKFTAAGYQCVNLVYRTPRPKGMSIHQSAWEDGQRAVRLVRRESARRGFSPEKIGTISMSAGSHLALLLATSALTPAYPPIDDIDETPCHINWAVTGAIAYALTDGIGCPNTTGGNGPDVKLDSIFKFDAKTAPMCMLHGGMDQYSPIASTYVYRRLRAMKVPAELHLFADRHHGFWGFKQLDVEYAAAYDHWYERAQEFLDQLGFGRPLGEWVKLMDRYPSDDARGEYVKSELWPEGRMPNVSTNQCLPYIEWHFPKKRTTEAIQIVYSGGAYCGNGPDGFEVAPIRRFLNEKGMTVVTMRYRTPRPYRLPKHLTAWQDLQRAVRTVRAAAPGYGLDPDRIGIMGSSAGGHLTMMGVASSTVSSYAPIDEIDQVPCNANWAIAVYPAYVLTDGADGGNRNGGNGDEDILVPELRFDDKCCPVLFLHGDDDKYAAMGSVKCWEKLRRMGVQCDLHTLVKRPHCFQASAQERSASYTWMGRIWEFLNHKGLNK